MSKAFVIRYTVRPEVADENQRLVEDVFSELNAKDPGTVHYTTLRLEDGVSFVHLVLHDTDEDDSIAQTEAFAKFSAGIADRVVGPPVASPASVVGSYRFLPKD